jgi:hypothetical protein
VTAVRALLVLSVLAATACNESKTLPQLGDGRPWLAVVASLPLVEAPTQAAVVKAKHSYPAAFVRKGF